MNNSCSFTPMASDELTASISFEGGSVEYISQEGTAFFDYDAWGKEQPTICNMSRVDALAVPAGGLRPAWLVEVKDFRVVNYPPSVKSTVGLPRTLEKKVSDTLAVLSDSEACPPALQGLMQGDIYFLFHYEKPTRTFDAYFPSGYPLDQFDAFQNQLRQPRIKKSFMMTASHINANETVPWEVRLHDTRVLEDRKMKGGD